MTTPAAAIAYTMTAVATVAAALFGGAWRRERRARQALEARLHDHRERGPLAEDAPPAMEGAPRQAHAPIASDPTSVARQEEMLRRSERLASLGRMLAGTAHELNNPLAAVCGFAQLLLRGEVSEEQRLALETIDREATRAAAVVRDLLTFARHHDQDTTRSVDLNAIARYVVGTRRYSLRAGGVSLELDLAPGQLWVLGVATQLEQVVFNLVANAEQALEASVEARANATGGTLAAAVREARIAAPVDRPHHQVESRPRIVVRTSRIGDAAMLRVEDNGPGIPADRLSLIWDPFWTTRADSEGTGLGLPVVHGIVSSHGGTAEVESRAGHGATFIVTLPLDEDVAGGARGDRDANGMAPHPLDVLVLGKEEDATFVTRLLGARGHAVVGASDPDQAIRLAAGGGFDVVVADAALLDSATELWLRDLGERRGQQGRRTRILLVTGSPTASPTADRIRADATLSRPFEVEALRRMVERE